MKANTPGWSWAGAFLFHAKILLTSRVGRTEVKFVPGKFDRNNLRIPRNLRFKANAPFSRVSPSLQMAFIVRIGFHANRHLLDGFKLSLRRIHIPASR